MTVDARRFEGVKAASIWGWIVGLATLILTCLQYPSLCSAR